MTVHVGAGLAADARGVEALRASAARDPKSAIKEAAKQFEALFMHELMKSMRQATQSSGLLDNSTTKLGTEMLDTQFAQQMTGLRGGLSEAIARHLERQLGVAPDAAASDAESAVTPANAGVHPASAAMDSGVRRNDIAAVGVHPSASATGDAPKIVTPANTGVHRSPGTPGPGVSQDGAGSPLRGVAPAGPDLSATQVSFVDRHTEAARTAQKVSGIPASFMIAQAAHESGWGQREIRNTDGSSSHNLFGIKAGAGWTGAVAEVTTTELIDGQAHKLKAKFRAYASYAESFNDYAKLIAGNPRYSKVLAHTGSAQSFAQELQRAGYATDPHYADKLTRTINTTLRLQRAVS